MSKSVIRFCATEHGDLMVNILLTAQDIERCPYTAFAELANPDTPLHDKLAAIQAIFDPEEEITDEDENL